MDSSGQSTNSDEDKRIKRSWNICVMYQSESAVSVPHALDPTRNTFKTEASSRFDAIMISSSVGELEAICKRTEKIFEDARQNQ